jgi:hypothetical protein
MNRNKSSNKQQMKRQNNDNNDFGLNNYDPFGKFKDFDRFFNDFNNDDMFDDFFSMKRLGDDNFSNIIK